jgi:antitoxin component YwqK of YwqJK toxin-antitoxin module
MDNYLKGIITKMINIIVNIYKENKLLQIIMGEVVKTYYEKGDLKSEVLTIDGIN